MVFRKEVFIPPILLTRTRSMVASRMSLMQQSMPPGRPLDDNPMTSGIRRFKFIPNLPDVLGVGMHPGIVLSTLNPFESRSFRGKREQK